MDQTGPLRTDLLKKKKLTATDAGELRDVVLDIKAITENDQQSADVRIVFIQQIINQLKGVEA